MFWIPLLLVIIHRSLPLPTVRDSIIFGAIAGAPTLSCMYAGIFCGDVIVSVSSLSGGNR